MSKEGENYDKKNLNSNADIHQTTEVNNPLNKLMEENPSLLIEQHYNYTKKFFNIQKHNSEKTLPSTKGNTYIGPYKNNQKNGKGKLIVTEQFTYEGNFKDDLFDGYGEYTCKQYTYKGTFLQGKKNGKGTEVNLINKIEYKGDFSEDKKNGKGEEKYPDGTIYIGDFKDNKKHGKGKMFLDGIKSWSYNGEFENDKISGKGKFKWNEQKMYFGSWLNNELSGYGILIDENTKYIGYLEHNMKNGYGAMFYGSQSAILGKWENDLINGYAIVIILNNNFEQNKKDENTSDEININNDDDKYSFKFVKTLKGEIVNNKLEDDELNKFKESQEYKDMIGLYKKKILPDFEINLDISKTDENEISSIFGNY